jgi:hypothetical protein
MLTVLIIFSIVTRCTLSKSDTDLYFVVWKYNKIIPKETPELREITYFISHMTFKAFAVFINFFIYISLKSLSTMVAARILSGGGQWIFQEGQPHEISLQTDI